MTYLSYPVLSLSGLRRQEKPSLQRLCRHARFARPCMHLQLNRDELNCQGEMMMALTRMRCPDCDGKTVEAQRTYTVHCGAPRTLYSDAPRINQQSLMWPSLMQQ